MRIVKDTDMDKQTTFSVIVPIYKVEKYLNQCIESILNQTFGDFELLLIDDGSPDSCPSLCDDYAERDHRISVIHRENGGIVRARETGILAAAGKYICWVDGDDFVSTELLEYLYQIIQSHGEPDMICFDYFRYDENRKPHLKVSGNENSPAPGMYCKRRLEQEIYPYMLRDSRQRFTTTLIYGSVWSKCFKRELITAHYCRDPRLKQGEDAAVVYECLFYANSVFCSDRPLYYYRQLGDSMIHSYDRMLLDRSQYKIRYLRSHIGNLSEAIQEQVEDQYVADLMIAVFTFARHHIPLLKSRREVKEMLRRTNVLQDIHTGKSVPLPVRIVVKMLRCRLYLAVLSASRLAVKLEEIQKKAK